MKRDLIIAAISGVIVGGCVPSGGSTGKYAYKADTTIARKHQDLLDCQVEARQEVPADTRVETTPVYTTPGYTSCLPTGFGGVSCTTTGGTVSGGDTYSYDANQKLRTAYEDQCLAKKGYAIASLPRCSTRVIPENAAALLSGAVRQPRDGACITSATALASNLLYPEEFKK